MTRLVIDGSAVLSGVAGNPANPPAVLRDPTDDYLVALAITARARAIVTGDKDLLDHPGLHPPAITARTACEQRQLL